MVPTGATDPGATTVAPGATGATTVVAPKSIGSLTTKGQIKPTSWQGKFNGVSGQREQPNQ